MPNFLTSDYGCLSGRLQGPYLFDGAWNYVLGRKDLGEAKAKVGDWIRIVNTVNLTGIYQIGLDASILIPSLYPLRDISTNATLQRAQVTAALDLRSGQYQTAIHPGTYTQLVEPFNLPSNVYLRLAINGGADQFIHFVSGGALSAESVANLINTQISGGLAQPYAGRVILTGDVVGTSASIEVKVYGTPSLDANVYLSFYRKAKVKPTDPTAIFGGDDLSCIVAPYANFASADEGRAISFSGCLTPSNNFVNYISAILDSERALLFSSIIAEPAGFTAILLPASWKVEFAIDGNVVHRVIVAADRQVSSRDFKVNVSKLAGLHDVEFRLRLGYV